MLLAKGFPPLLLEHASGEWASLHFYVNMLLAKGFPPLLLDHVPGEGLDLQI